MINIVKMSNKSNYLTKLEVEYPDVANRYHEKVNIIGGLDPFTIEETEISYDPSSFPPVTNMDLVSYLVLTTSFYTKDQMKAYKSLNSFKIFKAGFVTKCGVIKIKNFSIILARVKHSQRLNDAALQVWVISNEDGSIESAHCTCMAGAGEVCSHVGALLYAVEFITTARDTTSCTDVRSLWNVPTMLQVRSETIKSINFGRVIEMSSSTDIPAVTEEEMVHVLQKIKDSGSASVLMRVVEPFASELEVSSSVLYNKYKTLYNEEYESLFLPQLVQLSQDYMEVVLSEDDCNQIEKTTREQAYSNEWYNQRAGRITASRLKHVCRTSITKPSLSLIKCICYPLKFSFKTTETEWGVVHEPVALEEYKKASFPYHQNLTVEKVGLVVLPDCPQLGASPDALVHCTCCGKGCIEIKCPFLLKTITFKEYAEKKTSCLLLTDEGNIYLDKTHAYYFQVQQQMALTKTSFCEFVVWSPQEGTYIERVDFNEDFWLLHRELALTFHKNVIMPELLGRLFTRSSSIVAKWCICNQPDDGRPMICCDNELCPTMWYHFDCIKLFDIPNDTWLCNKCLESV